VPQHFEGLGVLLGEQLEVDLAGLGQFAFEVNDVVADLGGDGVAGQSLADRFGDFAGSGVAGDLASRSVGKA